MHVTACETHIVATPPPHVGGMYWIFVSLRKPTAVLKGSVKSMRPPSTRQ